MKFIFYQYRVSMIFLLVFQALFLPPAYRKRTSILMMTGCFLITGVLDYVSFFTNWGKESFIIINAIQIIVVQATALFFCCYRDTRALFIGITSSIYVLPGNIISSLVHIYAGGFWSPFFVQIVIHLLLLWILVRELRENYLQQPEIYFMLWDKLWIVPALSYLILYMLLYGTNHPIAFRKENWSVALLFLFLIGFIYVLILKVIFQQYEDAELKRNNEFLETYAWGLRREANALRRSEEKMKIMRHDSRHVYRMIGIYLKEGKIERIKELLAQLDTEIQTLSTTRFCENIVVNGILSGSDTKAKKKKITFLCEANVPKELNNINEFELATVISNLLENALYAASRVEKQEERKVVIRIFPIKDQLILEISNTFVGECKFSQTTGLPLSTKREKGGYGLRSVKAYANKYHAIFQYSIENSMFYVKLLLRM